jgi:hypothetical protein
MGTPTQILAFTRSARRRESASRRRQVSQNATIAKHQPANVPPVAIKKAMGHPLTAGKQLGYSGKGKFLI